MKLCHINNHCTGSTWNIPLKSRTLSNYHNCYMVTWTNCIIACISRVSSQNSPIFKAVTNIFEPDFICRRADDALHAAWMIDFLPWPFNICYSLLCHRPLFLIKFGRPISSTICKLGCCCCDTIRSFFEIELSRYQVIVIRDSNKLCIHEYQRLKTQLYKGDVVICMCLQSTQNCRQYNFERNQGSSLEIYTTLPPNWVRDWETLCANPPICPCCTR